MNRTAKIILTTLLGAVTGARASDQGYRPEIQRHFGGSRVPHTGLRPAGSLYALREALVHRTTQSQYPRIVPISPYGQTFYSYSPVVQPVPPPGAQLVLTFPGQECGSPSTLPGCDTFEHLKHLHYNYDTSTNTWVGPYTGTYYVSSPTMFNTSATATSGWIGISVNVAMSGSLGSNSSPATQYFVQSVFFSTSQCYEDGPEFGFARFLRVPGDITEESTVSFYYGLHVNCYSVGSLGSCRERNSGASLESHVVATLFTVPAFNSQGGTNLVYSAYLTSPTNWYVSVTDPYTGADVIPPLNVAISETGFFAATGKEMYSTGLTGFISHTQQRGSPPGGITDSTVDPLTLVVYSLAQVANP